MKKVLFVASECVPFVKTGGLADVVGSLPKNLDKNKFDTRVILPQYLCHSFSGLFQNRLLLELVDDGLTELGFKVLKHSLIPPNDGGIALGQAVYGMAYVQRHR